MDLKQELRHKINLEDGTWTQNIFNFGKKGDEKDGVLILYNNPTIFKISGDDILDFTNLEGVEYIDKQGNKYKTAGEKVSFYMQMAIICRNEKANIPEQYKDINKYNIITETTYDINNKKSLYYYHDTEEGKQIFEKSFRQSAGSNSNLYFCSYVPKNDNSLGFVNFPDIKKEEYIEGFFPYEEPAFTDINNKNFYIIGSASKSNPYEGEGTGGIYFQQTSLNDIKNIVIAYHYNPMFKPTTVKKINVLPTVLYKTFDVTAAPNNSSTNYALYMRFYAFVENGTK